MSNRRRRIPKYRHYKPKDLAVVRIDGQDFYLGKYDSPRSWEKYHRLLAEWTTKASEALSAQQGRSDANLAIKDLMLAYLDFADTYYVKNGKPTDEKYGIRAALRPLRKLYGSTSVCTFGPLALKAVRISMVEADNCRSVINQHIGRIRRMFKWGVENELVSVSIFQALLAVPGFRKCRSPARETGPIRPVAPNDVEATLEHVSPVVQAMVRFQLLTGCRPGEVCSVRPCDIDRTRSVWCFRPESHKTEHHDRERRIFIGPAAQSLLRPWLERAAEAYCFSPRESAHYERNSIANAKAYLVKARKPRMGRRGHYYTTDSYRRAITRACEQAGVPSWHPNQLRHTRGTELRGRFGLEGAQTVLGHTKADVTQIYAERDFGLAERIMLEVG